MPIELYGPVSRLQFIPGLVVDDILLEIGPGAHPQFRGPLIEYFDLMPAQEMKARYAAIGDDPDGVPDEIHYASREGSFDIVPDARFATVVSCHNIEHHPCLVQHLHDVSRVLKSGGAYVILAPDHRYCFDRNYPTSTIADVLGAWIERRTTHEPRKIIRQRIGYLHNEFARHWEGDHGEPIGVPLADALAGLEGDARDHIDVHAWQFTPEAFAAIIAGLHDVRLTDLRPEMIGDTPQGSQEFCAILRKD
jgi:SAM-dependent methyltransferase